ncbi:MAG TPA: GAF domain-containing protein [Candidatus Polarisedimenticolia bacterium]|nr:GAF domain-containing protein [Candidatus Polarisedimenticolia bacterium]
MSILEIDPSYLLHDPPELTRPIASAHWRELNMLIHSVGLLTGDADGPGPLLSLLRASGSVAGTDRVLLYRWDEVAGGLRLAAAQGLGDGLPDETGARNEQALASLLHRKPLLVSMPDEPWLAREMEILGARSALTVPLSSKGMPWGALQLLRSRPFTREEAVLFWLFALMVEAFLPALVAAARRPEAGGAIDAATGLLIPSHFRRRVAWEIQRAGWIARPLTMLCVEVTEMLHGRPRGGSMPFTPQAASQVIQKALGIHAAVTCLGGHHFLAVLPDARREDAARTADVIREGFLLCSAGTLPVFDIAVGLATYPDAGRDEAALIKAACAAGRRTDARISRSPLAG